MTDFLESLRNKAVYLKLSSKETHGGGVSVKDMLIVLKNLNESYSNFVEIEYEKISTVGDQKKLKRIKEGLTEENNLLVVNLKFESLGMAISPNVITYSYKVPDIRRDDQLKWKKEKFELYKKDVLTGDFNNEDYLKRIANEYSPTQRQRIFKPIIDGIINNVKAKTEFGLTENGVKKQLVKPKQKNEKILIPPITEVSKEKPEIKTAFAKVEIKGLKARAKVIELFDQIENPVYSFTKIKGSATTYVLNYPIYCELIHDEDMYSMENKEFGIYVFGKTIEEAQQNFEDEFDYLYLRYNSLSDDQLTDDVKGIKYSLNKIVQ